MKVKVWVLGAKEVNNTLKFIEQKTDKSIKSTLNAIGQIGADDSKDLVAFKTGRLKGSITWSINGRQFGYQTAPDADPSRDKLNKNPEELMVEWGTAVIYGPKIEAMARQGGQFLINSFLRNKMLFKKLLARSIKKGVTK